MTILRPVGGGDGGRDGAGDFGNCWKISLESCWKLINGGGGVASGGESAKVSLDFEEIVKI